MTIDVQTLLIAEGLVVASAGVSFIVGTVLGRATSVGRTWSAAFTAGILAVLCFAVAEANNGNWVIGAVGNASLVFAIGIMWSGCRIYNGRSALILLPVGAAVVTAIASIIEGPALGEWAGAIVMFAALAMSAGAAAFETARGALRREPTTSALTIVFVVVALYYVVRAVVIVLVGVQSILFTEWFGTVTTSLLVIVLVTVASISMSTLRSSTTNSAGYEVDADHIVGVVPADQFSEQLQDWLRRARLARVSLVLVMLEVDELEHLNSVFGDDFGDSAIASVGRTACESSPVASLVGRVSSRRLAVLTTQPVHGFPVSIAETMQTALVERPVDGVTGIRAMASFGVASTEQVGHRPVDLLAAARSALDDAISGGRGGIVAARGAAPDVSYRR